MRILSQTLDQIKGAFIHAPIESGGIIGSKNGVVCAFFFDEGNCHPQSYTPSVATLNAKIAEWADRGISFCGVIHSHHNDCRHLSDTDIEYAFTVKKAVGDLPLYFPIVTLCDNEVVLTSYRVTQTDIVKDEVVIA